MKICPLCRTKFDDSAEFCPSCKAQLEDLQEVEKQEKGKVPKSFWISLLCVFGFIGVMYIVYHLIYSNIY